MTTLKGVGPSTQSFPGTDVNHSSSGRILSLAISADPNRLYAGTYAGVWRSDDAGHTWRQLTGSPAEKVGPGIFAGIYAPHIHDITASPFDRDLVIACGTDGRFAVSR